MHLPKDILIPHNFYFPQNARIQFIQILYRFIMRITLPPIYKRLFLIDIKDLIKMNLGVHFYFFKR